MDWSKVWEKWRHWALVTAVIVGAPVILGELSQAGSVMDIDWMKLLDRMALVVGQALIGGTWAAFRNYRKHK